jgi:hypothetical protein
MLNLIFCGMNSDEPYVIGNYYNGTIEIAGRFHCEEPTTEEFLSEMTQWLRFYHDNSNKSHLAINFRLSYFTEYSKKTFHVLFSFIHELVVDSKLQVDINWFYDFLDDKEYDDVLEDEKFYADLIKDYNKEFPNLKFTTIPDNSFSQNIEEIEKNFF